MADSPIEEGEITDDFDQQELFGTLLKKDSAEAQDNYENINMDIETDSESGMQNQSIENDMDYADFLRQMLLSEVNLKKQSTNSAVGEDDNFDNRSRKARYDSMEASQPKRPRFTPINPTELPPEAILTDIKSNTENSINELYSLQKKFDKIKSKCVSAEKRRKHLLDAVKVCNNTISNYQTEMVKLTEAIVVLFKKSSELNAEKIRDFYRVGLPEADPSSKKPNSISNNQLNIQKAPVVKNKKNANIQKPTKLPVLKKQLVQRNNSNQPLLAKSPTNKMMTKKKKNEILEEKLKELETELLCAQMRIASNESAKEPMVVQRTFSNNRKNNSIIQNNPILTTNPPTVPPSFTTLSPMFAQQSLPKMENNRMKSMGETTFEDNGVEGVNVNSNVKVETCDIDEKDLEILDEICSEPDVDEQQQKQQEQNFAIVSSGVKEEEEIFNRIILRRAQQKYTALAELNENSKTSEAEAIVQFRNSIRGMDSPTNAVTANMSQPSVSTARTQSTVSSAPLPSSKLPPIDDLLTSRNVEKELQNPLIPLHYYRLTQSFPFHLIRHPAVSNKIDINIPLCPFQLHGRCVDEKCPWQHDFDYRLTDVEITCDFLNFYPSLCPQGMSPTIYANRLLENYSVEDVARFLVSQIPEEQRHNALSSPCSSDSGRASSQESIRNNNKLNQKLLSKCEDEKIEYNSLISTLFA